MIATVAWGLLGYGAVAATVFVFLIRQESPNVVAAAYYASIWPEYLRWLVCERIVPNTYGAIRLWWRSKTRP